MNSSTTFIFFQIESISINLVSGLTIARGIQGKPQPVHKSSTFHFTSVKAFNIIESIKCFSTIHSLSLIADKFIWEFFSIKISKNFSKSSVSF